MFCVSAIMIGVIGNSVQSVQGGDVSWQGKETLWNSITI